MLLRRLISRLGTLSRDVDALHDVARNAEHAIEARLVAAGTLTCFLSSPAQPLQQWLLDTLVLRLGLCTAYSVLGWRDKSLHEDILLVKGELSEQAVRRIESLLERLSTKEFAGGGMASVIADEALLDRLYRQALTKAVSAPTEIETPADSMRDISILEVMLA